MFKPDYDTLREKVGFTWYVNSTYYTLLDIAGQKLKDFSLEPDAGIEIFKNEYRNAVVDIFGEGVTMPGISTPSVSYGHINGLGFELVFPEDGEVNYNRNPKSLDEYIQIFKKDVDFSKAGMAPFYIDYKKKLEKAYPGEKVGFGYAYEGPITTAYELRNTDVFYDAFDQPEKFKEFLKCLTSSIIEFIKFYNFINGTPVFNINGASLYDDIAAMFSPSMWEEFVLPFWEQYYCGITDGKRFVHCEDLTKAHMQHLEKAQINFYDPGISHKLSPDIIFNNNRVPFKWRMGSFHITDLTLDEVEDWVYQAVADGSSCVFTTLVDGMTDDLTVKKVKRFIAACRTAEEMLKHGAGRDSIGQLVSAEGKKKFWKNWPREAMLR